MKRSSLMPMMLAGVLLGAPILLQAAAGTRQLDQQVRHELIMLPHYGVFDNLSFRLDEGKVTLLGQVNWPTLKADAERVVKQIEGVNA